MLKYRPDIDGLRAIAVLLVVGFHAAPHLVPGGYVGVDIFFVISGFLITGIIREALDKGTFSLAWFYSRRARRIFPALVVVLAFASVAGWFLLLPDQYAQLGKHIAGGAAFVSNLLLWQEAGYFDAAAETKPLLHLWSLGIEEQFYIVWPLLLYALHKFKVRLLSALTLVAALSFALNVYQVGTDALAAFYSPFTRFWELALGGILACHAERVAGADVHRWRPDAKALAGLALILAAVVLLDRESRYPGWWGLLPVVGAALLISAGPQSWIGRNLLSLRGMVWVGLISYPLYLWHWPLLTFVRIRESGDPSAAMLLSAVAASFVLSWLTYRFVEKPIRFGSRGKSTVRIAMACAALVAVFGGGLVVQAREGFVSRFPGQIQALAAFKYDSAEPYRAHSCFLLAAELASALQSCADGEKSPGKPVVLLWGDSYAAALYPGYRHVLRGKARLLQVTAVGCPPVVKFYPGGTRCAAIAAAVMRRVREEKVERVVLAANWTGHRWPMVKRQVAEAIAELRLNGVKRIDLVGQLPQWHGTLPRNLYDAYLRDKQLHQRLVNPLVEQRRPLEATLLSFAREHHVRYISPTAVLCNAQGCLTMVGGRLDELTSFDTGHLTATASKFVVERFPQ